MDQHHHNVSIGVLAQDDWPSVLSEFFRSTNLGGLAPTEAWTIDASNSKLSYSTHGLFRYFGKFPPPVATKLISDYSRPGELVIDPMCGSGTTGVEALWLNRSASLHDVSPLACLVTSVKTSRLQESDVRRAVERVVAAYVHEEPDDFVPLQVRDPLHWFTPATMASLRRLRLAVSRTTDMKGHDYVRLAFASAIRRASKATTQQGRLFLDVETALDDALPVFSRNAERGIPRVTSLPDGAVTTSLANARSLTSLSLEAADLAIIHPPYFNSYSYSAINTLEMGWLEFDRKGVRKGEVREYFKVAKREDVDNYLSDLHEVLVATGSQVKDSGTIALMMGDTRLRGEHINVIEPLLSRLPGRFQLEKIALRVPRFTEASWAASQRRSSGSLGVQMFDFILVFRMSR